MMDNEIEMTRGTTAAFLLEIVDDEGIPYVPEQSDVVRLGVKHDSTQSDYSIIKTGTYNSDEGVFVFEMSPDDTINLTAKLYGERYWYDVGLRTGSDYYIVARGPLTLYEAITEMEAS